MAKVELLTFAQDGIAESMLALRPEERRKKYTYDEVENVVRREHVDGNRYVTKGEYKLAAKR